MKQVVQSIGLIMGLAVGSAAYAADYPDRTVTIIVPFGAGSGADYVVRLVAEAVTEKAGQPFVVDNRPGASGTRGAAQAYRADPDGYTLVLSSAAMSITDSAYPDLPYESRNFENITVLTQVPLVLAAHVGLGIEDLDSFLTHTADNPGSVSFGSLGVATSHHVTAESFMMATGLEMIHVPYGGAGEAHSDLVGGHIDVMFDNVASMAPRVESGDVVPLAVTSAERHRLLPDVPTFQESGVADFAVVTWMGVAAPPGTPPEILDILNDYFVAALEQSEVQEALNDRGLDVVANSRPEAAEFLTSEIHRWAELIDHAGIDLSD